MLPQKRLEKRRKELEKKMKEDQEEQAALRKQEEKIVGYEKCLLTRVEPSESPALNLALYRFFNIISRNMSTPTVPSSRTKLSDLIPM